MALIELTTSPFDTLKNKVLLSTFTHQLKIVENLNVKDKSNLEITSKRCKEIIDELSKKQLEILLSSEQFQDQIKKSQLNHHSFVWISQQLLSQIYQSTKL